MIWKSGLQRWQRSPARRWQERPVLAACALRAQDRGRCFEIQAPECRALERAHTPASPVTALVVAGGVAANTSLRAALAALAQEAGLPLVAPPPRLCTDNAAMIGWAGAERFAAGLTDQLDALARPRWPLDPDAEPVRGAGVKA